MEKLGIKFTPKMVKDGEFQDTMTVIVVLTVRKQDKLDIEMIGLVKKKRKKSNRAIRRKFNGRLMKNAVRPSVPKIVLAVVQSVKQNAKHFNSNCWSTELQLFNYVTFSPSRSVRCETKTPAMRVCVEGYTKNSKRDTIKVFKPIVKRKEKKYGTKGS